MVAQSLADWLILLYFIILDVGRTLITNSLDIVPPAVSSSILNTLSIF